MKKLGEAFRTLFSLKSAEYRRYTRNKFGNFMYVAFLVAFAAFSVLPLVYCIATSFKPMDELLQHGAFFGFEDGKFIATGLGFGAEKGSAILKELMAEYDEIAFVLADGQLDKTPCPKRNTAVFVDRGLIQNNTKQILAGDILILPKEYLCPMDYFSGKKTRTRNTVSIHWFAESWKTEQEKPKIEYNNGTYKTEYQDFGYAHRYGCRRCAMPPPGKARGSDRAHPDANAYRSDALYHLLQGGYTRYAPKHHTLMDARSAVRRLNRCVSHCRAVTWRDYR